MQLTLEGQGIDQLAIERLKAFVPPEGYYVAFSGGKDSLVLYDLVKRSQVKHDVHMHLTTVDPPELIHFLRQHYPDVPLERPALSMWQLCDKHGLLPTRLVRFCCEALKEVGGINRLITTGVRWAESTRRKRRKMLEVSKRDARKRFLHPIIDWSDADVWMYIHEQGLAYCKLYDEGFKRLGCVGCPMIDGEPLAREMARYPKIMNAWHSAATRVVENRRAQGKELHFKTGDEYYDWWIKRRGSVPWNEDERLDCQLIFST